MLVVVLCEVLFAILAIGWSRGNGIGQGELTFADISPKHVLDLFLLEATFDDQSSRAVD